MKEIICNNCGKKQLENKFDYCSFCLKSFDYAKEKSLIDESFFNIGLEKNTTKSIYLEKQNIIDSVNSNSEHFKRSRDLLAVLSRNAFFMDVRDNGQVLSIKVKKKKRIIINLLKLFLFSSIFLFMGYETNLLNFSFIKAFSLVYFFVSTFLFFQYSFYQKNLIIDTNKQIYSIFNAFSQVEGDCSELSVGAKRTRVDRKIYFEVVLKRFGEKAFTFCNYNSEEECYGTSAIIAHVLEIEYDQTINELKPYRRGFFDE